jgi:hypothetical protein
MFFNLLVEGLRQFFVPKKEEVTALHSMCCHCPGRLNDLSMDEGKIPVLREKCKPARQQAMRGN